MPRVSDSTRSTRLALVCGYVALTVGIAFAYRHPATGYEASIYAATPSTFWIGAAIAGAVGVVVAMFTSNPRTRRLATVLGGFVAVAIVGLPLVRGYYFFASADTLTHLGWIRDLAAGRLTPFDLIYPADHTSSLLIAESTGYSLRRAVMLFVVLVVGGFVVGVTLAVWTLTSSRVAAAIGAFSAFMFLPINLVVTQPVLHPISQASLYLPIVLYLTLRYMTEDSSGRGTRSKVGVALALSSAGLVLFHPMGAVGMLAVLGTIAVVQLVVRRIDPIGPLASTRPLYGQALFLGVVLVLWAAPQEAGVRTADLIFRTLGDSLFGTTEIAGNIQQRQGSLFAIGTGLGEIFVKLFLVSAIYAASTGVLFLASLIPRHDAFDDRFRGAIRGIGFGLFALGGLLVLHFLGQLTGYLFRYVSMMMAIGTVLGAVSLYWLFRPNPGADRTYSRIASGALSVFLLLAIAVSVLAVFPSPYLYLPSGQVSEANYQGYADTFEHTGPDATIRKPRGASYRYRHAVTGTAGKPWAGAGVPPEVLRTNLTEYLGDDYLVITSKTKSREVDTYQGLRYTRTDFSQISDHPGLDRIQSNGEFVLYHPATNATGRA